MNEIEPPRELVIAAALLSIYVSGVVIALVRVDARGLARVGLALAWPLGPIAFVITIGILLLAVPIAFPIVGLIGLGLLIAAAVAWRWGVGMGL